MGSIVKPCLQNVTQRLSVEHSLSSALYENIICLDLQNQHPQSDLRWPFIE
jgi:hypothetical protein